MWANIQDYAICTRTWEEVMELSPIEGFHEEIELKLDGVGPVDNRLSNQKASKKCNMGHATCDT